MKYFAFLLFFLVSCKEEKSSSINLQLKKELAEMYFSDQSYRNINSATPKDSLILIAQKLNVDPVYFVNNYISWGSQNDAKNEKRIEEIIEKYGYPGKKLVGTPENETAWLIIQHSSPKMIEKYLPLIREANRNGDVDMQALALMEDRNLMYQGKEQIYGSQASSINGESIIWPIKDPKNVNQLRKEAGFVQTIEEYSKMLFGEKFQYKAYTLDEVKKFQQQ